MKKRFTRACLAAGGGVWQKRFWEHRMRHARDFRVHLDYSQPGILGTGARYDGTRAER